MNELKKWVEWDSGQSGEISLGKKERMGGWDANFIGLVLASRGRSPLF